MKLGIVVPAAGTASRFGGGDLGKLMWPVLGRPVLSWTLAALGGYAWPGECRVVIPARPSDFEAISQVATSVLSHSWALCEGGDTRELSVRLAVQRLADWATHILIHDAARPVLSGELLARLMAESHHDCVIPIIPCVDTLKEVIDGQVRRTVSRENLYRVQTPQLFRAEVLRDLYARFPVTGMTDEAGLCERAGVPVKTVLGDTRNLKLTHREDLVFLEMFLGGT